MSLWNSTTMQLYPSEHVPPYSAELVCRQSRLVGLSGAVVASGLLGGVPATMWYAGQLPNWMAATIGGIVLIVLPIIAGSFLATLRRTNWTLAIGPDGLWLNLRSYTNHQLNQGKTVVRLSYDELTSAARHIAKRSTMTDDGTMTWRELSLDLRLRSPDSEQLRQAIAEERARTTTRKLLGGLVTVSGRSNHVPVTVPQDGLVRVMWRSRYDFLRPGLSRVLDTLSRHLDVLEHQPPDTSDDTSEDWLELTDEQVDSRILQFVEAGDNLSAVKMLRLRRGYTLTEAKQFVNELTGRLATPNDSVFAADDPLSNQRH